MGRTPVLPLSSGRADTSPQHGGRTHQRRETNLPYLESSTFLLGENPTRARGEPAHHHGGDSPLLETPCAHQYKMAFRPIVVRARTSSGHNAKQYWLLLRTTTALRCDQYWSDFPPPTTLNFDSADITLTEQIKGLGLPPLRRKAEARKKRKGID